MQTRPRSTSSALAASSSGADSEHDIDGLNSSTCLEGPRPLRLPESLSALRLNLSVTSNTAMRSRNLLTVRVFGAGLRMGFHGP